MRPLGCQCLSGWAGRRLYGGGIKAPDGRGVSGQ